MTKIISISDEAYEELKKLKKDRSFSKIILELSQEKKKISIMEFAGIWNDMSDKEVEKIKEELRKERKIGSRRFT